MMVDLKGASLVCYWVARKVVWRVDLKAAKLVEKKVWMWAALKVGSRVFW